MKKKKKKTYQSSNFSPSIVRRSVSFFLANFFSPLSFLSNLPSIDATIFVATFESLSFQFFSTLRSRPKRDASVTTLHAASYDATLLQLFFSCFPFLAVTEYDDATFEDPLEAFLASFLKKTNGAVLSFSPPLCLSSPCPSPEKIKKKKKIQHFHIDQGKGFFRSHQ